MKSENNDYPRRILMTADAVGGVWSYALDLARALEPHGVEVFLATMGPMPDAAQLKEARSIWNLNLFKSNYRLEWMENSQRDVSLAGSWLLHLEQRLQPEVVHLNGYMQAEVPFRVPKLVVGHSCVISWWRAVRGGDPPAAFGAYRAGVGHGLLAADLVVAPTEAMLETLSENYGRPERTRVIPNARCADVFRPEQKRDYILGAGRVWDDAKNLGALARVAPLLNMQVFIAGDPVDPDGRAVSHENVVMLGKLATASLAHVMSQAAVFALPARYEPFGLTVLEAALSGCALVLGDIPSLRENWNDAALFVPPDDEAKLARALAAVTEDRSLREGLQQRALRRAADFTPQRFGTSYLECYAELSAGAREPGERRVFQCAS